MMNPDMAFSLFAGGMIEISTKCVLKMVEVGIWTCRRLELQLIMVLLHL